MTGVAPTTTRSPDLSVMTDLFVMAERMLVEVLGRIKPGDGKIVLPPMRVGDAPQTIRESVARHARDEARLAGLPEVELGADPHPVVARLADETIEAARAGRIDADELLLATITRCFLAHDVAFHLGSTACPLPEELARPLWEITDPQAAEWRERRVFGEPLLPMPPHVSWRDRFLRTAGRDPHPHFD
ncbi:hypothetical protein GCM10017691_62800 [Pseudonocardia petroleophila]